MGINNKFLKLFKDNKELIKTFQNTLLNQNPIAIYSIVDFVKLPSKAKPGSWLCFPVVTRRRRRRTSLTQILPEGAVLGF